MDFRSHPLNPLTVAGVGGAVIAGLIGAAVHPPNVLGPSSSPSTVFCPSGPDRLEVVIGTCPAEAGLPTGTSGPSDTGATGGTPGTGGPASGGPPVQDPGRSSPVIIIVSRRPDPQDAPPAAGSTEDADQNDNQDNNNQDDGNGDGQDEGAVSRVACPDVESQLPPVPDGAAAEVAEHLADLRQQIADADARLAELAADPVDDPGFVDNTVLGPLRDRRAATLDRITIAIGRYTTRPTGLADLAACTLRQG